jgi:hypothetical protein
MTSLPLAPSRTRGLDVSLATALLFAVLVALAASPVWLWPIPRGNDIVDHWARLTLYRMAPDDPLRALYHVRFGLIPNLGLDALYLALAPLWSPQTAVRVSWTLAVALPAAGAFALHRALFDKPSPTIWLIPFLSYNIATTGGLLNFALGMGLAFCVLAYVASRGVRLRVGDLIGLNLAGAALFFCHLIALAAFVLLFVLMRPWRRAAESALALILPLALTALREAPPSTYELGGSKMAVLFAPVATMTGHDLTALALLVGAFGLMLALGLRFAAPSALAGFALAAVLVPSAHGAANLIDARLAVYVWYFAFATTSLRAPERGRPAFAAAALGLTALRLVWVAPYWEAFQDRAAQARAGLASLPEGARALVVAPTQCGDRDFLMFQNLSAFAVIDRRAYVNTLFAQSGIQPVAPTDPALDGGPTLAMDPRWLTPEGRAELPAHMTGAPWAAAFADWRRHFTHVIDAHGGCAPSVSVPGLTRLGGAAGMDVYRID